MYDRKTFSDNLCVHTLYPKGNAIADSFRIFN